MLFVKNSDATAHTIQYIEGKAVTGTVLIKPLISGNEMALIEVQLGSGVAVPIHAHAHESVLYVVKGKIKTTVDGQSYILGPGDSCRHPRDVPHFVEGLEDSTWVEVKSPAPDFNRLYNSA